MALVMEQWAIIFWFPLNTGFQFAAFLKYFPIPTNGNLLSDARSMVKLMDVRHLLSVNKKLLLLVYLSSFYFEI